MNGKILLDTNAVIYALNDGLTLLKILNINDEIKNMTI
jgi:hypothetical protein